MRWVVLCSCLLVSEMAWAQPVAMTAATRGSALDLTFTNQGKQPFSMDTYVHAGLVDHYDWLTVRLTSKATQRTLHFVETRTRAAPIRETIPAGGSVTRSINLVAWAIREGNGAPLEPGSYQLEATWETDDASCKGKCPVYKATARLEIAAPAQKSCEDTSKSGLELLARQVDGALEVGLHHVDKGPHCVAAWIQTHEIQSDWLSLTLDPGTKQQRELRFDDSRDKSAPVFVELAPGSTSWTRWDLASWAQRARNGGVPMPKGAWWADVHYDASGEAKVWNGKLTTKVGLHWP
jgi:hypothetical protein